jgi:hypothetical protein
MDGTMRFDMADTFQTPARISDVVGRVAPT